MINLKDIVYMVYLSFKFKVVGIAFAFYCLYIRTKCRIGWHTYFKAYTLEDGRAFHYCYYCPKEKPSKKDLQWP